MAKDPICGMFVEEGPKALQTTLRGTTFYFCSDGCLKTFLKPEVEIRNLKRLTAMSFIVGIPLLAVALLDSLGFQELSVTLPSVLIFGPEIWLFIAATPVQILGGRRFYSGFLHALKSRTANMDTLIALGTSAAWGYSTLIVFAGDIIPLSARAVYFESSALIIGFILLGKVLEHTMKRRATDSVRKLMDLQPKKATVIRKGKEVEILVEELVVGDVILIKPGERIPVDGTVIEGHSTVDEQMITGESFPVEKGVNDAAIGATINKTGLLKIKTTKIGSDTTLSQIVKLVEEAVVARAPIERLVDKVSGYFVPAVIIIALISFAVWFFTLGSFIQGFTVLIAVLIIACPCALGLATPAAIMVGTGKGAENGILIKGGEHLEKAYKLQSIVFDKTGTLTKGVPSLTDIVDIGDRGEEEVVRDAAIVEKGSEHPLGAAIIRRAKELGLKIPDADSFEAIPGQGVKAKYKKTEFLVGNRKLLTSAKIDVAPYDHHITQLEEDGKTAMLLARDGKLDGILAVADTVKDEAKEAISELKSMGLEIIMLTGDNPRTAHAIAEGLGITNVVAEVLPGEKSNVIKKLQGEGKVVAMVGDGINDAPALAQSDIGIALGSGTDVAVETGGIVLLRNDLRGVVSSIKLSKATMSKIKQNLFWAFAYNSALIPVAAFGLLGTHVYLAGLAMGLSSVSVLVNSLTLRRFKLSKSD
ncbi:MAG: heavy metal translocating P-type ATPase [Thaumarchaeota archaeon]|nr:heavy metal translocating P-type ATPase [Nitrososphaerota archaeon]